MISSFKKLSYSLPCTSRCRSNGLLLKTLCVAIQKEFQPGGGHCSLPPTVGSKRSVLRKCMLIQGDLHSLHTICLAVLSEHFWALVIYTFEVYSMDGKTLSTWKIPQVLGANVQTLSKNLGNSFQKMCIVIHRNCDTPNPLLFGSSKVTVPCIFRFESLNLSGIHCCVLSQKSFHFFQKSCPYLTPLLK